MLLFLCSQRGGGGGRLHLLPELPALPVPLAALRPAQPRPEGGGLPHLQCRHGDGGPAHRHVRGQRLFYILYFVFYFFILSSVPVEGVHY